MFSVTKWILLNRESRKRTSTEVLVWRPLGSKDMAGGEPPRCWWWTLWRSGLLWRTRVYCMFQCHTICRAVVDSGVGGWKLGKCEKAGSCVDGNGRIERDVVEVVAWTKVRVNCREAIDIHTDRGSTFVCSKLRCATWCVGGWVLFE